MIDIDPFYADAIWLAVAFLCGYLAKRIGLPPLVGFLVGGFIINFSGVNQGQLSYAIEPMADIGVMLLLFTIGLKLKIKSLFRTEIWVTASIHMLITIVLFSSFFMLISFLGLSQLARMSFASAAMISFALSFSSTVFVVKTLEANGELESYHGNIAIGILVIQDILAVLFIAFSDKKLPSIWVIFLPLFLILLKTILNKILTKLEHGEMIPVFGFFTTFIAGALSFNLVGLKPDLGALVIGMLFVNHPRADELYHRMVEYKDFFLIAFFLKVGLIGLPSIDSLVLTLIILPLVMIKGGLFSLLLAYFKIQPRISYLTSLSLTNFSEFGLIVGVVGINIGLMSSEWIVVMALLMSFSFILSSPLNKYSHELYNRFKPIIQRLSNNPNPEFEPLTMSNAKYLVVGLGSVGLPTFETLNQRNQNLVLGIDYNKDIVKSLKKQNKNVIWVDTTDSEFWAKMNTNSLKLVYLTISDINTNINILKTINLKSNRTFKICAICQYTDEKQIYEDLGVDYVYEFKHYIGKEFVDQTRHLQ